MKNLIFILSLTLMSFSTSGLNDRDCREESSRVYDLAYLMTGNSSYAFIQATDWYNDCVMDNRTQISAPSIGE